VRDGNNKKASKCWPFDENWQEGEFLLMFHAGEEAAITHLSSNLIRNRPILKVRAHPAMTVRRGKGMFLHTADNQSVDFLIGEDLLKSESCCRRLALRLDLAELRFIRAWRVALS
jgi:hypothetical protein